MKTLERGDVSHAAWRYADEVCRRTGTSACLNRRTGGIYFWYPPDLATGVFEYNLREEGDPNKPGINDTDDTIRFIQLGKVDRKTKDLWAAQRETTFKNEQEQRAGAVSETRKKDARTYVEFLRRKRRGVSKTTV